MSDEARPFVPEPQARDQVTPARREWLWQASLIVFVSSACIMILELVAGRIVAPHVGSSLYTWTSVIGIVLAGISLGNYLGGRLADRWASPRLLGLIYLFAAVACLGVLWVDRSYRLTPADWPIVVEILVLTAALFFLPCAILGMISPIVAKLAVSDLGKTGSTMGKLYAAGALGSIVGTFATGFILISWLGTYTIIWSVAALLLAMGLFFIVGARWLAIPLIVLILAGGTAQGSSQKWLQGPCVRETNYYCIKINEENQEGEPVRVLVLDHLVHSYVSLENPKRLVYGYEKMYAEVAAYRAQKDDQMRVLMIGGGGYTFPRYLRAVYPGSDVHVVEIDPGVTQTAYDLLALPRDSKIVTDNEDARMYMASPPTAAYDLIMGDAFNHYSVPYHLTTKEFDDRVHAWLASDGLYVVNIIDGPQGAFLRAYYHTLQQTFRFVYLAQGTRGWRDTMRTTFVLIATDVPLDMNALARIDVDGSGALVASTLATPEEIERLLAEAPVVTLTDQYAPVDQMLAQVFREEQPK